MTALRATPSLLDMMKQLIAAPSVSSVNPDFDQSNSGVISLLHAWLESAGFCVEIQSISPTKSNLIARMGQGEHGFALCGHTDTVPFDEGRWQSDPLTLTERDGRYYGLGTADMKSFLAMAIEAARQFRPADLKKPLYILATADEESSMSGARALLARDDLRIRHAVIGEPTGLRPVNRHKGVFMDAIRLIGRSGHSSNPAHGNSALEGMAELVETLRQYRDGVLFTHRDAAFEVPHPTLNFGRIAGGDNPNRICGECELQLDVRLVPGMDLDAVRAEIRARAQRIAEKRGLKVEYRGLFDGTPAFHTEEHSDIVQTAQRLSGSCSHAVAFATEGPYLAQMGIDTIIMGPGDIAVAHQPDECLDLSTIRPAVSLLERLIRHYCL